MAEIRAFIAIELPKEIQKRLEIVIHEFGSQAVRGVRWVAVENIHLTLKFLGDVSNSKLVELTSLLKADSVHYSPFSIQVGGMGAFPNNRRPRVIWVGLQAPSSLNLLQTAVEHAANQVGISPEERVFSPHLTLGRVRNDASPADLTTLTRALEKIQVGDLGTFRVTAYTLFRSDLRSQGPLYTRLDHFVLAPNSA